ncbi:MAG: chorismate synthase [Vampirovibrionales bacterium]|nr:chorismate synthase [Vampirovibrionales bacterium]
MRFLTAGESHGAGLTIILDGVPAGLTLTADAINADLHRRQLGYGRGGRMHIERDAVKFTAGVRFGKTTGAPVCMFIENRDAKNWLEIMDPQGPSPENALEIEKAFIRPRPGHADLAGYYKYRPQDLRDVLERASARETAARVAAGAVAKAILSAAGATVFSHVLELGGVRVPAASLAALDYAHPQALIERIEGNDLRAAADDDVLASMRKAVDDARMAGTTLGGEVEVLALNVPPGLGSYTQWDRKLDGQLAQAVMSIHAVKAVALGDGVLGAQLPGHAFHDAIERSESDALQTIRRPSNRAGGLEGGVTNGMPVVVRAIMKPIATLRTPLTSVNLSTAQEESAHFERSDVTAVAACGVVCEAMVAWTLANALLAKFGEDTITELQQNLGAYQSGLPLPTRV